MICLFFHESTSKPIRITVELTCCAAMWVSSLSRVRTLLRGKYRSHAIETFCMLKKLSTYSLQPDYKLLLYIQVERK